MNYLLIILGIVLILVSYYVYLVYYTQPIAVKLINLSNSNPEVSGSLIKNPISVKYSYTTWIYISTYPTTLGSAPFKPLFSYVPSVVTNTQFVLYLSSPTTLSCGIGSSTSSITGSNNSPTATGGMNTITITNNMPIQKWVCVVVSTDGVYADIYMDGKLVVSKVLQNKVSTALDVESKIMFGRNQDVHLANISRVPYQLDPQTVWSNYMQGNGQAGMSNLYSSYNGKFVLSDGTSSTDYKVF